MKEFIDDLPRNNRLWITYSGQDGSLRGCCMGLADARLSRKILDRLTAINVSTRQSLQADGCEPGVRVGMHVGRGQRIGGDT